MRQLWRRFQWFWHRQEFDRDLEEEMQHHLAMKTSEEGGRAARRRFGNVTYWMESSRMVWSGWLLEQLAQDVRYGLRGMNANRLFTALAVLSLALGIGANTAIFSFLDAILLRALPVAHPEELVLLNWQSHKPHPGVANSHRGAGYPTAEGGEISPNFPYPAYQYLRARNKVFSSLFGFAHAGRLNLVVEGQALLGDGVYVDGNYFEGLSVTPVKGRLPGPADDAASAAPAVAISYAFWQAEFHAAADVVGKPILLNNKPFTVTGVCPPNFAGVQPGETADVFVPARFYPQIEGMAADEANTMFKDDHFYWIELMARLKPGVTPEAAQTEMRTLFRQWVSATARNDQDRATLPWLTAEQGGSGVDSLRRRYAKSLYLLMATVALILLLACINIANLLLARATRRRREIAVRLSLGAGRLRIIRQLLTESVLLSILGAALSAVVAAAGIRALTMLLSSGEEQFGLHADVNWHVLLFSLAVAVGTGILFGIAPAIQATRMSVTPALKEAKSGEVRRPRRIGVPFSLTHVLMTSQIAISLVLVACAALFVRTFVNLNAVPLGFNRDNVLLFSVDGSQAGYRNSALKNLYAEMQRRFTRLPGVRSVTLTDMPLVSDWVSTTDAHIGGRAKGEPTAVVGVGPNFFSTLELPVVLGRALDERDHAGQVQTAVVNQLFASRYFPGMSALGRHFRLGGTTTGADLEIVGVAKNARYSSLRQEAPPVTYVSYLQKPDGGVRQMFFEVRTAGDPLQLANEVRKVVHDAAPRVPVADVKTQKQSIDETISQERTFAALCSSFGMLALLMACVGLYATTAYAVTRRTNEIGIRMALGARRNRILWMVVQEVLLIAGVGLAAGFTAVWQVTTLLTSFLYGLTPHDSTTMVPAGLLLLTCVTMAGFVPAWRAARIEPMAALRHE